MDWTETPHCRLLVRPDTDGSVVSCLWFQFTQVDYFTKRFKSRIKKAGSLTVSQSRELLSWMCGGWCWRGLKPPEEIRLKTFRKVRIIHSICSKSPSSALRMWRTSCSTLSEHWSWRCCHKETETEYIYLIRRRTEVWFQGELFLWECDCFVTISFLLNASFDFTLFCVFCRAFGSFYLEGR